jgi:histidine triad (HIT) family protein
MDNGCIFCRIAAGELPAERLYEDGTVLAFRDIRPVAPVHILVIPRQHIVGLADLDEATAPVMASLFLAARHIAAQEGLAEEGYRLVINQGVNGGQSVYHLHLHILGGRHMGWPPG